MAIGFTLKGPAIGPGHRIAYARAAELNPWDPMPHMHLAPILLEQSDFSGAERALERVVELDRSNVQAQVTLARLLAARGARELALRRVRTALAFEPGHADALELRRRLGVGK